MAFLLHVGVWGTLGMQVVQQSVVVCVVVVALESQHKISFFRFLNEGSHSLICILSISGWLLSPFVLSRFPVVLTMLLFLC
jgi:hypothetical protein